MKKVLIEDNLKAFIDKGKNILLRDDIRIFTASTGEVALKIHRALSMDLLVIDLDMAKMSGDEVCSIIRNNDTLKNVSIILLCDNNKSAIARCQKCRANAFITKPINYGELFQKMKKFLNVSDRISLRAILNIAIKSEVKDSYFFANSENISSSGMLFETDKVLAKGDKLRCAFFIGSSLITANVKVIRVVKKEPNQYNYGVQFINLSDSSKARMVKFIEKIMKGE
jgi:response regulator RpfG family c-di-GMP phosphodiesterase